jgi:hypothetical protein
MEPYILDGSVDTTSFCVAFVFFAMFGLHHLNTHWAEFEVNSGNKGTSKVPKQQKGCISPKLGFQGTYGPEGMPIGTFGVFAA